MTLDDDDIRSRLRSDTASGGSDIPAWVVLGQLKPRLRRARRRRRIAIGTTSVMLIGGTGVALGVGLDSRSTIHTYDVAPPLSGVDEQAAGPTETDGPRPTFEPARSSSPDTSRVTTSAAMPTTSTSAPAPASPGISVPAAPIPGPTPGATTVPAPEPTVAVVDSTVVDSTVATVATATTSDVAVTTAPAPSAGTHRIDSACGSIVVETVGDRVHLVDVITGPGVAVDVKHDGPANVEVGLHGDDDECELEAHFVGGQLVTSGHGSESVHGSESREPGVNDSPDET
jgi:hypothetical protein